MMHDGVKWPHFSRFTEYLSKSLGHKGKGGLATSFLCFITHLQPVSLEDSLAEVGLGDVQAATEHIHHLWGWHQARGNPSILLNTHHTQSCVSETWGDINLNQFLTQSLPKPNITNTGNTYLHSYTNKNKSKCSIENQNSCIIASYYARQTFYKDFIYLGGGEANPSKPWTTISSQGSFPSKIT